MCDHRSIIESVNPRVLILFGYDDEAELVDNPIEILIPKRFCKSHIAHRESFVQRPTIRSMGKGRVLFAKKKDGSEFPVEISLSHYKADELKIIAFISDISERQKIEREVDRLNHELERELEDRTKEINRQNKLLRSISRNFPQGNIYVVNRDYEIIMADGMLLRQQGCNENTLVGHSFVNRLNKDLRETIKLNLDAVLDGATKELELEIDNKYFSLLAVPLNQIGDSEVSRILIVELDMTSSKLVERDMEAALQKEKELSQLKSHFVSLVSHEFRTPLSTIFSSSQLIEKYIDEASHSKRIRHTNKIQTSVSVLNNMIEDILSLSKLDEGKVNLKIERFDLYRLCQNIIGDLKSIYADLSVNLIGEDAMIKSDPKLVKHILSNIIENACKYGKKGGEVKVELSKVNSHVEVTVADNGIGIPDEEQKNLFDRFYRASNAENIKGTGLGLNIVMKYLDILGGAINFESEQNVGTSFHITIPKK